MDKIRSKPVFPTSLRIGLVDPNIAQTWAQRILPDGTLSGEVQKGDTINHTTSEPIANGLFCEKIFGPRLDYTCACGEVKFKHNYDFPEVCPSCHVEWTQSSVRRHRLGFIPLISPVTHKWFNGSAYIPALMGTTFKAFKDIRECRLFFPFSLQNREKHNPLLGSQTMIEKSKKTSQYLLLFVNSLEAYTNYAQGGKHADSKSSTEGSTEQFCNPYPYPEGVGVGVTKGVKG